MSVTNVAFLWPYKADELARSGYAAALSYTLRITTTRVGTVTEDVTFDASGSDLVSGRSYWLSGDDQLDVDDYGGTGDLVRMLEYCLNRNTNGITFVVTRTTGGAVQIFGGTSTLKILWSHANTTLNAAVFGFDQATDYPSSALALFQSVNVAGGQWLPGRGVRVDDVGEVHFGGIGETPEAWTAVEHAPSVSTRDLSFQFIDRAKGPVDFASATEPYNTFGHLWRALRAGKPVRYYPDASSFGTTAYTVYRLRAEGQDQIPLRRDQRNRIKYQVDALPLFEVAA